MNQLNTDNPPSRTGEEGLSRRTIVAGAAWTIPVVAMGVAAPLAAASGTPCGPGQVDFSNNYARQSRYSASGSTVVGSGTVNYTLTGTDGTQNVVTTQNFTVAPTSVGSMLTLSGSNTGTGSSNPLVPNNAYVTTYRMSFDRPVTNIRFTVWDVDGASVSTTGAPAQVEHVRVETPGTTATPGSGLVSSGSGYYRSGDTPLTNRATTSRAYAIDYVITGPVSSFLIQMSRPTSTGGYDTDGPTGLGLTGPSFTVPC
ncbi:hypothetical protein [Pseudoclavibacter sp. VKM Ac-2888]|uniref:hypothetical protein n=1 Tax=Pseudoclavibacter sp. VKM Ac-2888 TaxID=2783830 RepID=UPI00188CDEDD|nr:hypothetical protein [Pseudoclavibacter sp. VKM Ac-2888]MBF4549474.1 hypothetical protein [Pseudoclavibacter sp. VKM Ac-2888]